MSEPSNIAGLLGKLASGWGMEHPMEAARLFSAWPAIVGPDVASKCWPTSLKQGVLKVGTSSAAWASEFRYLAPEVIRRINLELGKPIVQEIKPWVDPQARKKS